MERRYLFHYRNSVKNCFLAQNFTEIGQSAAELWCKEKRFLKWRPFAILNFENAHIWSSGWCHRVPNVQSYTQCHPNRMIFHWVTAILRFAIGRQSTILNFKHSHSRDHVTVTEFNHRVQSPHLCTKFHRNRMIFRSGMSISRFSRWQLSAILNFRGPIMGSLKSPCKTYMGDHICELIGFWDNRVICTHFGDRQTDRRTNRFNRWTASMH